MKQFVIFGDSIFAERICKYIQRENVDTVLCFTNEQSFISRHQIGDLPVVPFEDLSLTYEKQDFEILICIGYGNMNRLREKIYSLCKEHGYAVGSWISTTAVIYTDMIDEGNIIMPCAYIGPTTTIGKCNIIASCVCISHDIVVGDFNFISSSATLGGFCNIANNSFIGLNATIKDNINIENCTLVGAAANIIQSTENYGVYVGNPAKKIGTQPICD